MNIRNRLNLLLALGCCLTLVACDDEGEFENGYYIDHEVSGVTYSTEDKDGINVEAKTGEDNDPGLFKYLPGNIVALNLGDTDLGQSLGKARLTPFDLNGVEEEAVGGCDVNGELPDGETDPFRKVQNQAVLLHTFDDDGEPSNGIVISPAVADLFDGDGVGIDLDQSWDEFSTDPLLTALLQEANDKGLFQGTTARTLRDRVDALKALYQGLELCTGGGTGGAGGDGGAGGGGGAGGDGGAGGGGGTGGTQT